MSGFELLPAPIPALLKHCVNLLRMHAVLTKATAFHILKVINNLTLSILVQCLYFASPIGLGNLFTYMPNGAELCKRNPKMNEILEKPCSFTRGLRIPRKEELTGLFSLPGIPEEREFCEAWDVIGTLQHATSVEPPSFTKEAAKVPEGSPKKNTTNPSAKSPKSRKTLRKGLWAS